MNASLSIGKRVFSFSTDSNRQTGAPQRPGLLRRASGKRMFEGATSNRLTADLNVTITSADAEILVSAIALRSRLRKLARDDDYMRSMLLLLKNNVAGHDGIQLKCRAITEETGELDEEANNKIEAAWNKAMEEENYAVTRSLFGGDGDRLAVESLAVAGAILFRKHRPFPNAFQYALEPIEIDRLDHWYSRPRVGDSNEIKFGIERDAFSAPVAYHILTRHPGDVFSYSPSPRYRERVPAEDIIAVWTIERPGQSVGMPLWPSIARRLGNLHRYEEAEVTAASIAAAKGGWFERMPGSTEDGYSGPMDDAGNKIQNVEPGMWEELPLGWKAVPNDPSHPTEAYADFMKGNLRGASAGAGLPYASVASDLAEVNYSSFKAGRFDAQDLYRWLQGLIIRKVKRAHYRDWLPYAILSGQLDLPMSKLRKWKEADHWQPRTWRGLEPLKEMEAHKLAVACGFSSRRAVIEEAGGEIHTVFQELEEDRKLAEKHGLMLDGPVAPGAPLAPQAGKDAAKGAPAATAAAAAVVGDVQSTALNGAQVTALADLMSKVASGELPLEAAKAAAAAAFPLVSADKIADIFDPLRKFKPAAKESGKDPDGLTKTGTV